MGEGRVRRAPQPHLASATPPQGGSDLQQGSESRVFILHKERQKTKTLDSRSGSGMTGGEVEDDRGLERGSRNEKLQTVEGIG